MFGKKADRPLTAFLLFFKSPVNRELTAAGPSEGDGASVAMWCRHPWFTGLQGTLIALSSC